MSDQSGEKRRGFFARTDREPKTDQTDSKADHPDVPFDGPDTRPADPDHADTKHANRDHANTRRADAGYPDTRRADAGDPDTRHADDGVLDIRRAEADDSYTRFPGDRIPNYPDERRSGDGHPMDRFDTSSRRIDRSLSHLGPDEEARMVDVGQKKETARRAVAEGWVHVGSAAAAAIADSHVAKGNVLQVARLAGIGAAKRTFELIPLCHVLPLDHVQVDLTLEGENVRIVASASAFARTGVEMEAMTAVSVAALTVYDMLKAVEKGIEIGPIRLLEKSGGKSGDFRRA
jgi:cyclic pyranopterin phosphate synthase